MSIEYKATFPNVNKDDARKRLKTAGAVLVRPEYLQRRIPFWLPGKKDSEHPWLRVRDEGDKISICRIRLLRNRFYGKKSMEIQNYLL